LHKIRVLTTIVIHRTLRKSPSKSASLCSSSASTASRLLLVSTDSTISRACRRSSTDSSSSSHNIPSGSAGLYNLPCRQDVEDYQNLRATVNELVGRVNGRFGTVEFMSIHFMHKSLQFDKLCALYTIIFSLDRATTPIPVSHITEPTPIPCSTPSHWTHCHACPHGKPVCVLLMTSALASDLPRSSSRTRNDVHSKKPPAAHYHVSRVRDLALQDRGNYPPLFAPEHLAD
jgi:Glycosyltransferase family 20